MSRSKIGQLRRLAKRKKRRGEIVPGEIIRALELQMQVARAQHRTKKLSPKCIVYCLRDLSGAVRYVGQTRSSAEQRLKWHFKEIDRKSARNESLSPAQKWLRDLRTIGATPAMEVLSYNGLWDATEAVWIDRMRARGEPLLNVAGFVA